MIYFRYALVVSERHDTGFGRSGVNDIVRAIAIARWSVQESISRL